MNKHVLGMLCAIAGGASWGFSGSCGQLLFQEYSLDPIFVCSARVLVAAICLLTISFARNGKKTVEPLRSRRAIARIVAYAILGVLFTQLCYLLAINNSNAGTATALEYIGPVLVVLVVCVRARKAPEKREVIAVLCVAVGTFMLATHGNPGQLVLTPPALFWGLMTAVSTIFYTLIPEPLVKKYDVTAVLAWAFIIDAVIMGAAWQPWTHIPAMGVDGWVALIGGLALVGTVISFVIYSQAIKMIGPSSTSMLASIEVVVATVLSAFWLGTSFTFIDLIGILAIASTAIILGKDKEAAANGETPESSPERAVDGVRSCSD